MAPIKFEEHLKDKLDKRTLPPSNDAWNKLSKRLDEEHQENNNNKPYKWWLGIAGSIIGVAFVVSMFLNNKAQQEITPQIVVNPEIKKDNVHDLVTDDSSSLKESLSQDIKKDQEEHVNQLIQKTSNHSKTPKVYNSVAFSKNDTNNKLKSPEIESVRPLQKQLTFEEQKIQEVVAQVKELKEKNTNVTDQDIEMLLQQAQQEIALEKLYNKNTGLVDASKLLEDVELELDKSFREKVFQAMKASYNSLKTAVAQRND